MEDVSDTVSLSSHICAQTTAVAECRQQSSGTRL